MKNYYLIQYQEKIMSVYMDMYGIDAGVEVIKLFESHGSLGKAMIEVTHKIKEGKKNEK